MSQIYDIFIYINNIFNKKKYATCSQGNDNCRETISSVEPQFSRKSLISASNFPWEKFNNTLVTLKSSTECTGQRKPSRKIGMTSSNCDVHRIPMAVLVRHCKKSSLFQKNQLKLSRCAWIYAASITIKRDKTGKLSWDWKFSVNVYCDWVSFQCLGCVEKPDRSLKAKCERILH